MSDEVPNYFDAGLSLDSDDQREISTGNRRAEEDQRAVIGKPVYVGEDGKIYPAQEQAKEATGWAMSSDEYKERSDAIRETARVAIAEANQREEAAQAVIKTLSDALDARTEDLRISEKNYDVAGNVIAELQSQLGALKNKIKEDHTIIVELQNQLGDCDSRVGEFGIKAFKIVAEERNQLKLEVERLNELCRDFSNENDRLHRRASSMSEDFCKKVLQLDKIRAILSE